MKHSNAAVNAAVGVPPVFVDGAKAAPEPNDQAPENVDVDVEGGGVRQRRMSLPSQQCDIGDKGFLTKSERVIRQYDTNNDGRLSMNEIKKIVHDLQDSNREKRLLKKVAIGAAGCLAVSATANFGLTWTS